MLKLYFGNSIAVTSTILMAVNVGYLLLYHVRWAKTVKWGPVILGVILLHGVYWGVAYVRDLIMQMVFIEGSRISLYRTLPGCFDYL